MPVDPNNNKRLFVSCVYDTIGENKKSHEPWLRFQVGEVDFTDALHVQARKETPLYVVAMYTEQGTKKKVQLGHCFFAGGTISRNGGFSFKLEFASWDVLELPRESFRQLYDRELTLVLVDVRSAPQAISSPDTDTEGTEAFDEDVEGEEVEAQNPLLASFLDD